MQINTDDFNCVPSFKTKITEPINSVNLDSKKRLELLKKASYNVFKLDSNDVTIDFLTDSGTGAMSQEQWSAMFLGDEAYAGASSFKRFEKSFQDIMGMKYVLPVHQGRAAERTLFFGLQKLGILKQDSIIASNAFFDTTLGWASQFAKCENLYCDDFDLGNATKKDFKGNLELSRLEKLVNDNLGKVNLVLLTLTNNTGGGQPVSMKNIKELSAYCKQKKIIFFMDACRFAENAYFIKTREQEYKNKTIKEIVKEMFSYFDGATFSAKKDAKVNIGGAVLFSKDCENIFLACRPFVIQNEGLFTYGGLAGRDMEAVAQGINETTEFAYLQNRIGQIEFLHKALTDIGIPLIHPCGGHAVYIDAKDYLSQIPETEFRADMLVALIYAIGGIRSVPIGNVMYAEKDSKGNILKPAKNDFVRLAVPRNVYSLEHMIYVINVFEKIHKIHSLLKRGIKIGPGFRNDHFDHFDCVLELLDKNNFEEIVLKI